MQDVKLNYSLVVSDTVASLQLGPEEFVLAVLVSFLANSNGNFENNADCPGIQGTYTLVIAAQLNLDQGR